MISLRLLLRNLSSRTFQKKRDSELKFNPTLTKIRLSNAHTKGAKRNTYTKFVLNGIQNLIIVRSRTTSAQCATNPSIRNSTCMSTSTCIREMSPTSVMFRAVINLSPKDRDLEFIKRIFTIFSLLVLGDNRLTSEKSKFKLIRFYQVNLFVINNYKFRKLNYLEEIH